jgi:hypothetical protein
MLEHARSWVAYNYICVAIAYAMLAMSLWLMPVNISTKGYLGMGIIFLSGSLIQLVKTLQDLRIQGEIASKLERAKQERLLQEYAANS